MYLEPSWLRVRGSGRYPRSGVTVLGAVGISFAGGRRGNGRRITTFEVVSTHSFVFGKTVLVLWGCSGGCLGDWVVLAPLGRRRSGHDGQLGPAIRLMQHQAVFI